MTLVCVSKHQVVLTISQMMWCKDMDACLEGDHDHFAALQKFEQANFDVKLFYDKLFLSMISLIISQYCGV